MQSCTSCGKEVAPHQKFCRYCGAPVAELPPPPPPPALQQSPPPLVPSVQEPGPPHFPGAGDSRTPRRIQKNTFMIAAVVILVVLGITCLYCIALPRSPDTPTQGGVPVGSTPQAPAATTPPVTVATPPATTVPTPAPDPFPGALSLKEWFSFGKGKVESRVTVYRFWMNDTYQWHNDMDAKWYTQRPEPGNKYLFVFVNIVNQGTTRVWYPKADNFVLHYNSMEYHPDPTHYIPDKSGGNLKATPIEVGEVQFYPKLFGAEYVEDFGLSHGTMSDFVYPGESNAVDGYIIYKVPSSLTAGESYVAVSFNSMDSAVWKLA